MTGGNGQVRPIGFEGYDSYPVLYRGTRRAMPVNAGAFEGARDVFVQPFCAVSTPHDEVNRTVTVGLFVTNDDGAPIAAWNAEVDIPSDLFAAYRAMRMLEEVEEIDPDSMISAWLAAFRCGDHNTKVDTDSGHRERFIAMLGADKRAAIMAEVPSQWQEAIELLEQHGLKINPHFLTHEMEAGTIAFDDFLADRDVEDPEVVADRKRQAAELARLCRPILVGFMNQQFPEQRAGSDSFTVEDMQGVLEDKLKEGWSTDVGDIVARYVTEVIPSGHPEAEVHLLALAGYLDREVPRVVADSHKTSSDYYREIMRLWEERNSRRRALRGLPPELAELLGGIGQ